MKLSVCMIVKNEEKYLARALDNLIGVVDEICILDTGSIDKTLEIAEKYGAKIETGGDPLHKGQSRNRSIEMATGDYVIILDADETIRDPFKVREYIEKTLADVYYIRLAFMKGDKPTLQYSQARIFKRGAAQYKYRAHEIPIWDKSAKVDWSSLVWEHRPPADRTEAKKIYALERLLLDVKENPDAARPLYYLGRQYYYMGQYQAAIKNLQKYIDFEDAEYDLADAHYYRAICYNCIGFTNWAIDSIYKAISIKPKHREYWSKLAEFYKQEDQPELAYAALRFIEKLPAPKWDYRWEKYYGAEYYDVLALAAYQCEDYEPALKAGLKAAELSDDPRIKENLNWYKKKVNNG
jgi:glycosyltransferase involved in cell wall biosynthesis